jgi:hypothetical protein
LKEKEKTVSGQYNNTLLKEVEEMLKRKKEQIKERTEERYVYDHSDRKSKLSGTSRTANSINNDSVDKIMVKSLEDMGNMIARSQCTFHPKIHKYQRDPNDTLFDYYFIFIFFCF